MMQTINNEYFKEIKNLADGLISRGIGFTFKCLYDGFQIVVNDWNWDAVRHSGSYSQSWDAVCHSGSYGHEEGLLEVMGSISRNSSGSVEGCLTAEDILARI